MSAPTFAPRLTNGWHTVPPHVVNGIRKMADGLIDAYERVPGPNERLLVLVSYHTQPVGWHLSISHQIADGRGGTVPGRYPTWDEISDARYRFLPDDVTMCMQLPPRSEFVNVHDTCFHLYQHPEIIGP